MEEYKLDEQSFTWLSSSHPISDIRDWKSANHLELRPDFQRNDVWSDAARVMLIDSILRNIPIPKVFLTARIVDKGTFRSVIDGQQRLKTILDFLGDGFELKSPYNGSYVGMTYSALPQVIQDEILQYKIVGAQ